MYAGRQRLKNMVRVQLWYILVMYFYVRGLKPLKKEYGVWSIKMISQHRQG